jgi:hypothetical protein
MERARRFDHGQRSAPSLERTRCDGARSVAVRERTRVKSESHDGGAGTSN